MESHFLDFFSVTHIGLETIYYRLINNRHVFYNMQSRKHLDMTNDMTCSRAALITLTISNTVKVPVSVFSCQAFMVHHLYCAKYLVCLVSRCSRPRFCFCSFPWQDSCFFFVSGICITFNKYTLHLDLPRVNCWKLQLLYLLKVRLFLNSQSNQMIKSILLQNVVVCVVTIFLHWDVEAWTSYRMTLSLYIMQSPWRSWSGRTQGFCTEHWPQPKWTTFGMSWKVDHTTCQVKKLF